MSVPSTRSSNPAAVVPDSLGQLAEITAFLAMSESLDDVAPGVLEIVCRALRVGGCGIWLLEGSSSRLARRWTFGADAVDDAEDRDFLERDSVASGCFGVRLLAGRRTIGVLVGHRPGQLNAEESLFVSIVADILAPVLSQAEYAHRLESEVRERTRQIETQRRFMARVVDSLPLGLYVIDRDYRIQAWNRKRETGTLGVSREEAIGRTIFEILHRQPAEVLRQEFEEVFETGRMQQFQIESTASGETRTYRLSKIPMRLGDGEVTHVITIGEDITDWREAQDRFAQAEKLAALGTLAAGVMHEINNPMATIAACAEATTLRVMESETQLGPIGAEIRDALRLIEQEVVRCKRIVDTLLDFSRPKPSQKAIVALNDVIERTLFLLKHHPRFKKLTVFFDAAEAPAPYVLADEEQLIQVFVALLVNAADAMAQGGDVTIRTRYGDESVIAEVNDRGEGIRRADLPKIFEPFFTTKPPGRGTGLGLSICYAIVSEHGGRIEVESDHGEGSTFRILLPRQPTA